MNSFGNLALEARMNLHVIVHYGQNTHHIIEAIFKALGRALDEATTIDPADQRSSIHERNVVNDRHHRLWDGKFVQRQ